MANDHKNSGFPLVDSSPAGRALERVAYYQAPPAEEPESAGAAIPFAHYLWILRRHKWQLLAFVVIAVASTVVVSSRLTPYYESTATIDVDRMVPTGVIGQDANSS